MKAGSVATILILAIFVAGCGPQEAQPTLPTGSSPTQLPAQSPALTPRAPETTVTAQSSPTPADVTSPTRAPTPTPATQPTSAPTATSSPPTATFPPPTEHETAFLRSLSSPDLACVPSHIRTDDQFWKLVGYVSIYDDPEEKPPEFICMSDEGKFLTYVMGYFEQYEAWPEDYERFPKLTPEYERYYPKLSTESHKCMLETLGQVEHPQRDPDDEDAWEIFNTKVLFGLFLIPIHCLNDQELDATGLFDRETDRMRYSINEWGGPLAMMAVMFGQFTDDVEQRELERRAREVEKICFEAVEPPQTPHPTP